MTTAQFTALEEKSAARLHDELRASSAPRFLMNIIALPPGEYVIPVDADTLDPDDREGNLTVWLDDDNNRRAMFSYAHMFASAEAQAQGLQPVYVHIAIDRDNPRRVPHLCIKQSADPSYPEQWAERYAFDDLANDISISDFCDFNSLPTDPAKRGQDAPAPISKGSTNG